MRRLGELCSKAVTLFLLDRTEAEEAAARAVLARRLGEPGQRTDPVVPLSDDAKAIIAYLRRVGPASPADISQYTELSRTTVFRRLHDLGRMGVIRRTGNTRSVQYGLVSGVNTPADRVTVGAEGCFSG